MKRRSRDEEREQRITMEIVVDAHTPKEQAMGWYYSKRAFPFRVHGRTRPGRTAPSTGVPGVC